MERVRVVSTFLVGLFFASIMANAVMLGVNNQQQTLDDVEHDPMFATGYHSSSALLVQDFEIIEFNDQSPPYRWVKLYGQSDLTYINVKVQQFFFLVTIRPVDGLHLFVYSKVRFTLTFHSFICVQQPNQ